MVKIKRVKAMKGEKSVSLAVGEGGIVEIKDYCKDYCTEDERGGST